MCPSHILSRVVKIEMDFVASNIIVSCHYSITRISSHPSSPITHSQIHLISLCFLLLGLFSPSLFPPNQTKPKSTTPWQTTLSWVVPLPPTCIPKSFITNASQAREWVYNDVCVTSNFGVILFHLMAMHCHWLHEAGKFLAWVDYICVGCMYVDGYYSYSSCPALLDMSD